jgi:hypothetical protein
VPSGGRHTWPSLPVIFRRFSSAKWRKADRAERACVCGRQHSLAGSPAIAETTAASTGAHQQVVAGVAALCKGWLHRHWKESPWGERRWRIDALRRNAEIENARLRIVEMAFRPMEPGFAVPRRTRCVGAVGGTCLRAAVVARRAAGGLAAVVSAGVVRSTEEALDRFATRTAAFRGDDASRGDEQPHERGGEKCQHAGPPEGHSSWRCAVRHRADHRPKEAGNFLLIGRLYPDYERRSFGGSRFGCLRRTSQGSACADKNSASTTSNAIGQ